MLVVNTERKKTVKLHMFICMLLIVLSVVFSLLPLAKINMYGSDEKSSFRKQLGELVGEAIDGENSFSKGGIGAILFMLMSIAAVMYIVVFSVVVPIIYILVFLTSLKTVLGKGDCTDRGEYYAKNIHKVSGKLPRFIAFPLLFMLFPYLISKATYGTGTLLLIITALVCVFVNAVFARFNMIGYSKKNADGKEMIKNANIIQGISLITLVGLLVFAFSFMKTGIVKTFFYGPWATYAIKAALVENASNVFLIDALMVLIMVVLLFFFYPKYIGKDLQRFSLAGKQDNNLALSVFTLAIVLIPMILAKVEHSYNNFIDATGGATSFLQLSSEQSSALTLSLIGAIIAFASEITIIVLKKALRVSVDKEAVEAAMSDEVFAEEKNNTEKEVAAADVSGEASDDKSK